jgi:uncharacterized membrane protein YfcA
VTLFEALALLGGGLAAGTVNTLAGGGSLLSVPLLVMLGLPGGVANGTNRIGILLQNGVAAWRFRAKGIWDVRSAALELAAVAAGALAGAIAVVQLSDRAFERAFALAMSRSWSRRWRRLRSAASRPARRLVRAPIFFAIGLYGGALQAGVGVLLVFALSWAGYDLVRANGLKARELLLHALRGAGLRGRGEIAWLPAAARRGLARAAIMAPASRRGGERLIRPVLAIAVLAWRAALGRY